MTKSIKFVITRFVFSRSKCTKIRFRPGHRSGPRGGAYDAPPDPLVGWGGVTPSTLDAFGVSNSAPTAPRFSGPPQHKILATPVGLMTSNSP